MFFVFTLKSNLYIIYYLFVEGGIAHTTRVPDWAVLEQQITMLNPGGRYKPRDCLSRNRVAIIVPYRDRETHLKMFLQHLHPFLQRQQLDYGIYVIELVRIKISYILKT